MSVMRALLMRHRALALLVVMAALGMRTSLPSLFAQGWRPFALLTLLTILLVITAMASMAIYSL